MTPSCRLANKCCHLQGKGTKLGDIPNSESTYCPLSMQTKTSHAASALHAVLQHLSHFVTCPHVWQPELYLLNVKLMLLSDDNICI